MASAFSSSDTAILTAPLELDPLLRAATASASQLDLATLYDVERTCSTILAHGFKSVALQFPDEALVDSVPVYWALRDELARRVRADEGPSAASRELPELYILADTSYGNCCVDEVAAAHVDADLVVHYGHTCLSPTANIPALYVFPRLPIDTAHASSSLASFVQDELGPKTADHLARTLVLAYDVAYAHAAEEVLEQLRADTRLQEAGWDVFRVEIDTSGSFEDKLQTSARRRRAAQPASCATGAGCACSGADDGAQGSCCRSDACQCTRARPAEDAAETRAEISQPTSAGKDEQETGHGNRIPLTSGRSVRLPTGRTLEAASSAVVYLGPESRALTNLLLHFGPTFPVLSYDPTQYDASSSRRPVRRETGKTNRLLMQRYAMVQRARDASVVGLLVGTLGVASYLPLLDRLRARLSGSSCSSSSSAAASSSGSGGRKKGGRKVYTVSVGKLNPAKLANFQEIEVWVLVACPENSLVGSKGGASGGPNGHGADFWRPIVTPFEMELALGPEGVWTGEYEVDLAKIADKLGQADIGEGDGGAAHADRLDGYDGDNNDSEEEEDDRPHYSFVTGSYVSRTRYGGDGVGGGSHEGPTSSSKPGTVVATVQGGKAVSVIQSASGLTHLGASKAGEREWGGLTRPEGVARFVPSVLEVGRSGIAGGYAHAGGQAEGAGGQSG